MFESVIVIHAGKEENVYSQIRYALLNFIIISQETFNGTIYAKTDHGVEKLFDVNVFWFLI